MNRRTFIGATVGALVASVLPVKVIYHTIRVKNLTPGDFNYEVGEQVFFRCTGEKPEPHTVTHIDDRNLLLECTPRGKCKYPLTHWLPRKWALEKHGI